MSASAQPWTCPFCPLLCDAGELLPWLDGAAAPVAQGCARATGALAHFDARPSTATPLVQGRPADLAQAVAEAARLLAASRQPLFGGLGTDVAGARALYPLACTTGAVCDAAQGDALMAGVRALQDRGGFTTTIAEVRTRADLVVCFGGLPTPRHPEFLTRAGLATDDPRLLVLAEGVDPFAAAARLAALVEGRSQADAPPDLAAAAQRLLAARYAVLVYEPARLPPHGELVIELLQRVVATLNRSTRAAGFPLGGGDGAATVNQVFGWLSGLPLRTRLGPYGLDHQPVAHSAARLVADGAVDLLLWLATFSPEASALRAVGTVAPSLPRIVIGHPGLASLPAEVFIPVATPGVGTAGHLFRTDGVVLLPLHPVRPQALPETLPDAAQVLQQINAALRLAEAA